MKKIALLSLILVFMISSSVQAGFWPYHFVVWDGKEYEVKQEELIEKSEIGKSIGKVKTKSVYEKKIDGNSTSLMTYYGNFSNIYPVGTPYYEIKGISTSTTIAVKVDNQWVKAVYAGKAHAHVMNTITNLYIIAPIVIIPLILFGFFYRAKKIKKHLQETNLTKAPE